MEFLDSNKASFNTLYLVTSLIQFFVTYLADSSFNIPISFSFMFTLYPEKQNFLKVSWCEKKVSSYSLLM